MSWWQRRKRNAALPELNVERRQAYANAEWLVPWIPIEQLDRAAHLKAELARELPKEHILKDRDAEFVAQRQDRDDFLVALEQGGVAIVHLTWALETDPQYPGTAIFSSFEEWRLSVMVPDAEEWGVEEEQNPNSLS